MFHKNSEFFFSKPLTFFGSFEQFDEESEDGEEISDTCFPCVLDIHPQHPAKQTTGLYLHWLEFDL